MILSQFRLKKPENIIIISIPGRRKGVGLTTFKEGMAVIFIKLMMNIKLHSRNTVNTKQVKFKKKEKKNRGHISNR